MQAIYFMLYLLKYQSKPSFPFRTATLAAVLMEKHCAAAQLYREMG